MKVLHLTTHLNIGGIANYIVSLAKALKAKDSTVIVASSGGNLETELEKSGVPHIKIDIRTKSELSLKIPKSIIAAINIVRAEKVDIIHAHTRVSQVAAFFVSKITGVPYVTTCHGFFKTRARKIFDTWGKKVIAISKPVKDHLEKDLGVKGDRIKLIYSGVDISRFSKIYSEDEIRSVRDDLGLKPGPIVGTIGRLSSVKGQRFLIEAMKYIKAGYKDAQCIILGAGEEEGALKDLSGSLGLDDSIRFFKSDPDTPKFLAAMDVFVFPSIKEGLGIALLEAMAAGKPCVASRVGGIEDIIKNGINGILVGVGDAPAIGEAVTRLLKDEVFRKNMGENGRAVINENFSLDRMAREVMDLYKKVSEEHNAK